MAYVCSFMLRNTLLTSSFLLFLSLGPFVGTFLVILARTLTGVQGDIRCKVLAALSTVLILACNLSWDWPNRRL